MILIVDNYDSFVHNLARYVREAGFETTVVRNDASSADELLAAAPEAVILSPGPNAPREAGVTLELIAKLPAHVPLLGVCLGHQAIVQSLGGRVIRAREPLHGEASLIRHDGEGLFKGLPDPMEVGRYHSLIAVPDPSSDLLVGATSAAGEVMAVRRRSAPWHGVQFHPESVLTPNGRSLLANFLGLIGRAE